MWPSGPVTHYNIPSYNGQVTHYNVTIWVGNPLQYTIKKILVFFNHWVGRLEQLDHSRNSSRFFYHWAGCPKQFDPFQTNKKNKKKTKNKKSGTSFKWLVLSVKVICQSTIFKVFQDFQKSSSFVSTFFFFINLLRKAKGK